MPVGRRMAVRCFLSAFGAICITPCYFQKFAFSELKLTSKLSFDRICSSRPLLVRTRQFLFVLRHALEAHTNMKGC